MVPFAYNLLWDATTHIRLILLLPDLDEELIPSDAASSELLLQQAWEGTTIIIATSYPWGVPCFTLTRTIDVDGVSLPVTLSAYHALR